MVRIPPKSETQSPRAALSKLTTSANQPAVVDEDVARLRDPRKFQTNPLIPQVGDVTTGPQGAGSPAIGVAGTGGLLGPMLDALGRGTSLGSSGEDLQNADVISSASRFGARQSAQEYAAEALGLAIPGRGSSEPTAPTPGSNPRASHAMDGGGSDTTTTTDSADTSAAEDTANKSIFSRAVDVLKSIANTAMDAINGGSAVKETSGKAAGATAGTFIGFASTVLNANTDSPSTKADEVRGWGALLNSKERGSGHEQFNDYGPDFGEGQTPTPDGETAPANEGEAAARAKRNAIFNAMQLNTLDPARIGKDAIVNPNPENDGTPRPGHEDTGRGAPQPGSSSRTGNQVNPVRGDGNATGGTPSGAPNVNPPGGGVVDPPKPGFGGAEGAGPNGR
jgi:hypothetical protein